MEKPPTLKPIESVIFLSGLPPEGATDFLRQAFTKRGYRYEDANLEDLREVLADLLQDLILESEEVVSA